MPVLEWVEFHLTFFLTWKIIFLLLQKLLISLRPRKICKCLYITDGGYVLNSCTLTVVFTIYRSISFGCFALKLVGISSD